MDKPDIRPKKASPLQVARTVFWSFFGIRKRADYDRDAATVTPVQVIVAGLIGSFSVDSSVGIENVEVGQLEGDRLGGTKRGIERWLGGFRRPHSRGSVRALEEW